MKAITLLKEAERNITANLDGRPTIETARALVQAAQNALMVTDDTVELKDIRDKLQSIEKYIKEQKCDLITSNTVVLQRMRTQRKIGKLIPEVYQQGKHSPRPLRGDGMSWDQSSKWQRQSSVHEQDFELWGQEGLETNELTDSGLLHLWKLMNSDDEPPELPDGIYRVLYADPPWSYGNLMPDYASEQGDHYKDMTAKELCELPVKEIAADNAVLFLWTTSPMLAETFDVIRAWGFEYKTSFIWDKVKHNMGHYNSVRHEFLLVCTRGSCQPDVLQLFDSVYSEERTEHSKKPDYFREVIDTIYPNGSRVELFGREKYDNWEVWGNEI